MTKQIERFEFDWIDAITVEECASGLHQAARRLRSLRRKIPAGQQRPVREKLRDLATRVDRMATAVGDL
jgi:hypothetical protein